MFLENFTIHSVNFTLWFVFQFGRKIWDREQMNASRVKIKRLTNRQLETIIIKFNHKIRNSESILRNYLQSTGTLEPHWVKNVITLVFSK